MQCESDVIHSSSNGTLQIDFECLVQKLLQDCVQDQTVLDLGGFDGRQAAWCLEQGASRAICVDNGQWEEYDWEMPKRFPGVEYVDSELTEYSEPADIVIFQNVIYHQKNPWGALEQVRRLTKNCLVLVTSIIEGESPVWKLYRLYEGHPISWTVAWRPTASGILTLLELCGFKIQGAWWDSGHLVTRCSVQGSFPRGFGRS